MPQTNDVEVVQPNDRRETSRFRRGETFDTAALTWMTPGRSLATKLSALEDVLLVAERVEAAEHSVVIVLSRDPETTLDAIYNAEQELYKEFEQIRFGIRVKTLASEHKAALVPHGHVVVHTRTISAEMV